MIVSVVSSFRSALIAGLAMLVRAQEDAAKKELVAGNTSNAQFCNEEGARVAAERERIQAGLDQVPFDKQQTAWCRRGLEIFVAEERATAKRLLALDKEDDFNRLNDEALRIESVFLPHFGGGQLALIGETKDADAALDGETPKRRRRRKPADEQQAHQPTAEESAERVRRAAASGK